MKTPKHIRSRGPVGGFTIVEIMIVVAVIGVLAALAIPNFVKARTAAQVKTCITNLRKIDAAKQQWALEEKKGENAIPVSADVVPYLKGNALPRCPSGGTYSLRRVSRNPTCTRYQTGHTLNNLNMDDDALPD